MDKQSRECTSKQIVILLMAMILGVSIGWLGFLLFGDLATNTKIVYVSQKEILKLEKARIAAEVESTNKQQQKHRVQFHVSN